MCDINSDSRQFVVYSTWRQRGKCDLSLISSLGCLFYNTGKIDGCTADADGLRNALYRPNCLIDHRADTDLDTQCNQQVTIVGQC